MAWKAATKLQLYSIWLNLRTISWKDSVVINCSLQLTQLDFTLEKADTFRLQLDVRGKICRFWTADLREFIWMKIGRWSFYTLILSRYLLNILLRAEQSLTYVKLTRIQLHDPKEPRAPKWIKYDQRLQKIAEYFDGYTETSILLMFKSY